MDLAKKEKERKEGIKKRRNTKRDMEGCTDKEGWKEGEPKRRLIEGFHCRHPLLKKLRS